MERRRSVNYTQREKEISVCSIEKYFKIIENKKTDAVFNKQKAECWEKLTKEFNSTQTTGLRTGAQLKATYEKMKQLSKQHESEGEVDTLETGGETFVTKLTHLDERILMLLTTNFFSIENTFDSNGNGSSNTNPIITSMEQNEQTTKTFNKFADQKSKLTGKTDQNITHRENSKNIIFIHEPEENHDTTANTDVLQLSLPDVEHDMSSIRNMLRIDKTEKSYRSSEYQNRVYEDLDEDIVSCQASIGITPKIPSESIEVSTPQSNQGKKRKLKSVSKKKNDGRQSLLNEKIKLLEKKSILDIIKDVETENLKYKKMDNYIKEIVKEREKLGLKIKYKEYESMNGLLST